MSSYCTAPGCEDPTRQGRRFCGFHEKRHQRGKSLTAAKQERLKPEARLLEAALAYADAEDDEAFEKAMQSLVRAAKQVGSKGSDSGEVIRAGMAAARARGVHVGRRHEVDPTIAHAMVKRLGTKTLAARALGVSRDALRAALARGEQGDLSRQPLPLRTRRQRPPSSSRAA